MLNLPGLNQVSFTDSGDCYEIVATVDVGPPVCACAAPHVVANGRRPSVFADTPMHGKRVEIKVLRQRYICRGCGESLADDIPHVVEKHRITERCYTESFTALARRMDRTGNGYSFDALRKRLIMAHGIHFREPVRPLYCFPFGPPKDIGAVTRRLYPVAERPVIGYRLSTLAKWAAKLPSD